MTRANGPDRRHLFVAASAVAVGAVALWVVIPGGGGEGDAAGPAAFGEPPPPPVFRQPTAPAEWVRRPLESRDFAAEVSARLGSHRVDGVNAGDAERIAAAAAEMFNLWRHGDHSDWVARNERLGLAASSLDTAQDPSYGFEFYHRSMEDAAVDLENATVLLRMNGGQHLERPTMRERMGGRESGRSYRDAAGLKPGDVDIARHTGPIIEVNIPVELKVEKTPEIEHGGYIRASLTVILAEREDGEWVPVKVGVYGIPNGVGMNSPWI